MMSSRPRMVWSVFLRNFFAYFSSPTGYVFITVFILLGAIAAFWQGLFFLENLANLDQLNRLFPMLLLFFVPALTMNVWSEERRGGTDELLFTLPGRDVDIVLGKYLAVLGIYTVATLFSLSHLLILLWLGEPDLGLMFATYLGYWISGAALLAVGMVASLLTANATVAFILGAVFCSVPVFIDQVQLLLGERLSEFARVLGLVPHLRAFGDGLVPAGSVIYFGALTVVMLFANVALLGRRHHGGGERALTATVHGAVRTASLAVAGIALCVLADRGNAAIDTTAERLHSLQPRTAELLEAITEDRPVFIQAFVSPEVPEQFVPLRKDLLNLLRRLDRMGGDRVRVAVHDTEPYSERATHAADNYGIVARPAVEIEGSQRSIAELFLGVVFTSGPEEFVIPFLEPGLPVEYEIARSIRVVSQAKRAKVGVVRTDAQAFGGFDFESFSNRPSWSFVNELRKQYELVEVAAEGPYPRDLDAVVAILPSSLTQPELDALEAAMLGGTPALLIDDPLPVFNLNLSPSLPKDAGRNPFSGQNQPPAPPKGDFRGLLARFGLAIDNTAVVWSATNPHPALAQVDPEVVFVVPALDNPEPFDPDSVITSGLQEVVMLYPGSLRTVGAPGIEDIAWRPLLRSGTRSGATAFDAMVQRNMLGMVSMNPFVRRFETPDQYVLATEVSGRLPAPGEGGESTPVHLIAIADSDVVSETFFSLRRQGVQGLDFDNVTFALNCLDVLVGDESFIDLRKHRPLHRTLTRVEELSRTFRDQRQAEVESAEAQAEEELGNAQERLQARVDELRARDDLDEQTKTIMLQNLERVEQRRYGVLEATINQEKERRIARARAELTGAVSGIQRNIKWWAAILPPIPTLVLAIALYAVRLKRERSVISERQRARSGA